MRIYQVFSYRKFVTSLFASCSENHNLVDFHRIELVLVPKFHKLSWLHFHRRYRVRMVSKRPLFFSQSARAAPKILNVEYYFIWVETSKIHNSVNFYWIGPIFLHKVTDSEIYNFTSKVEIGFFSDQYQIFY